MMNFKEYIINDISEKKVLIDLLPKNTARRKEKYKNTLDEIKEKYQDSKINVSKYIDYKYNKLLPKKSLKNFDEELKEINKLNELLLLGNPLTSYYEKMEFDLLLYDLMHYYDNSLDDVNDTICKFITKINDANVNVDLNDFKLNVYTYLYMKNIYDDFINKKLVFNNDTFETIYWKCPKVIEQIIICLRIILRKNEKKFNAYTQNKYLYKMKSYGFNTYDEVVAKVKSLNSIVMEKQGIDEYDIVNMCFDGKLDVNSLMNGKDSDLNFFMIQPIDLSLKKNYEKYINGIKALNHGLKEYLFTLEYRKFLDEFRSKYKKFVEQNDKNNKLNGVKLKNAEIIKLENKILKLRVNVYVSNTQELESRLGKRDNDKIFMQEELLEQLYKQYIELDSIYFDEIIKKYIKINTYVSDVFEIFNSYPYFNKKMIKKVFELEKDEEINEIKDKMKDYIYSPYRKIIDMIPLFVDKNIPQLLMNGYRFENLNINEESFDDDNINNIFEKCNRIITSDKISKFKLSIDEINFLINVHELKKKDLI